MQSGMLILHATQHEYCPLQDVAVSDGTHWGHHQSWKPKQSMPQAKPDRDLLNKRQQQLQPSTPPPKHAPVIDNSKHLSRPRSARMLNDG
jgi:hypothetical protein